MNNHRMKLIASLATIALCVGPFTLRASEDPRRQTRTETRSSASGQTDPRSSESSTYGQSTDTSRSSEERSSSSYQSAADRSTSQSTGATNTTSAESSGEIRPAATVLPSSGLTSSMTSAGGKVRLASADAEERSSKKFEGKKLRSSDGRDVGKIKDFVVDTQNGRISHVVVSSGGLLGIGETLRVVTVDSLQQAGRTADGVTLQLSKSEFDQLPEVQQRDLEAGQLHAMVSKSSVQRTSTADASLPPTGRSDSASDRTTAGDWSDTGNRNTAQHSGQFSLASDISGKELQANDSDIGEIESIVVDLSNGTAEALIDPKGSDEKVIVSFSELQFVADADVVTTTLSPSDITAISMTHSIIDSRTPATDVTGRNATNPGSTMTDMTDTTSPTAGTSMSGAGSAYSSDRDSSQAVSPSASGDGQLPATGRMSGEQGPGARGNSEVAHLATSIRRAFDQDQRFAREKINVSPTQGKIVLRGTVSTEDLKNQAEEFAKEKAQGQTVENKIRVQDQRR